MSNESLALFLAHSIELESEAKNRYQELSETMATHHNDEVAQFFARMAREAKRHLKEVRQLAKGLELPKIRAWEFDWPGEEPPETASYEELHYLMTLRQAIEIAIKNERTAERYYRAMAATSSDQETITIATEFADEEVEHTAALEKMLADLPENGSCPRLDDDEPNMPE